jgi:hypothetical protein
MKPGFRAYDKLAFNRYIAFKNEKDFVWWCASTRLPGSEWKAGEHPKQK